MVIGKEGDKVSVIFNLMLEEFVVIVEGLEDKEFFLICINEGVLVEISLLEL